MPAARRTNPKQVICSVSWRDKGKSPVNMKSGMPKTTADKLYDRLSRNRNVTDVNMFCRPKKLG